MYVCMYIFIYIHTSYRYYGQITWTRDCIRHTAFFWTLSLSLSLSLSLHRHHTRLFSRRGRAFLLCHLPGCCIEPSACKCGRSGQWTAPKHILLTSWLNHLESGAFWNHLESSGINMSILPSEALAVNGQGVSARSAEDSVSKSHKKQLQGANVHPQSAWVGAYSVFNIILHLFSTCPTKKCRTSTSTPFIVLHFRFPSAGSHNDSTAGTSDTTSSPLPRRIDDSSAARSVFLCHQKGWHRLSGAHGSCSLVSPLDGYIYITHNRRKFRSQTSDTMGKWKSRGGKIREDKESEERRCRCVKKGRKVAIHCVFFPWFVARVEK